jgi:hypothetical protein
MTDGGNPKIFPRNLTARAAHRVAGNPVSTRLESGVANCFPGLEFDVRMLDTRFFPGLLFRIVTTPLRPAPGTLPNQQGFRLLYLDYLQDPLLPMTSREGWVQTLLAAYLGDVGKALGSGRWYLDAVEQGGKRLEMHDPSGGFWDGERVWFFVRAIAPDVPVTITLVRRDAPPGTVAPVVLTGPRRTYVNAAGVLDAAFRAGELTESMCNPWQHDFRDCGCHYWAANHPDVVFGEVDQGLSLPDGQSSNAQRANTKLDWIRDEHSRVGAAAAGNTVFGNRPYELDHFEINRHWERLRFVVEGREIEGTYAHEADPPAVPYAAPDEMIDELEQVLAPMEMTLALEYLYALFTVRDVPELPAGRWPTMRDDVTFIRRMVTLVAVGEMTHLRWANQLLWELHRHGFFPKGRAYRPVVEPGLRVPSSRKGMRPRTLQPLTLETVRRFVTGERPNGPLDNAYARCAATLEHPMYPRYLYELAVRIDSDGMDHYGKFRDIERVVLGYSGATDPHPYLRTVHTGSREATADALREYDAIVAALKAAYAAEAEGAFPLAQQSIATARTSMDQLLTVAEDYASRGIGIPFWEDVQAAGV